MREKMEKYRYGPLVWNTLVDEDDSGNFYWNGLPPVGYDQDGIPVDKLGKQCLPGVCPLHPDYKPSETEYNEVLKAEIPTFDSVKAWFDDQYIIVEDRDIYFYIFRWFLLQRSTHPMWKQAKKPVDWMINKIWQLEEHKS